MLKALSALTHWFAFYFLPAYVVMLLLIGFFITLTIGWTAVRELYPVLLILNVPMAGLIAASQAIPITKQQ